MNKIFLLGRLTRDPEVRVTGTGKSVCSFTLAVDRPIPNQQGEKEADFINIVAWGKQGELVGDFVKKGQRLLVEGRLQLRSYDGKDGVRHYVTEVIADRVEFIERKNGGEGGASYGGSAGYGGSQGYSAAPRSSAGPMASFGSEARVTDEDVPF